MSANYILRVGPVEYRGWADGRQFSLVDLWHEVEGLGDAHIYDCRGRLVLANAGQQVGRRWQVRSMFRQVTK